MKKDIHPQLYLIEVTDVKKNVRIMCSTYNRPIFLNLSRDQHPAWTGKHSLSTDSQKNKKFEEFFPIK